MSTSAYRVVLCLWVFGVDRVGMLTVAVKENRKDRSVWVAGKSNK